MTRYSATHSGSASSHFYSTTSLVLLWGLSCGVGYRAARDWLLPQGDNKRSIVRDVWKFPTNNHLGALSQRLWDWIQSTPPPPWWWLLWLATTSATTGIAAPLATLSLCWTILPTIHRQEPKDDQTNDNRPDETKANVNAKDPPDTNPLLRHAASSCISGDGSHEAVPSHSSPPLRHLEMLVHNVSHTDLVLSVEPSSDNPTKDTGSTSTQKYCLCRPRFSAFQLYCQRIQSSLASLPRFDDTQVVSFPRYERNTETPRYSIVTPKQAHRHVLLPTGIALPTTAQNELEVAAEEWADLRIRSRDVPRVDTSRNGRLNCVFFPVLATLLPRWEMQLQQQMDTTTTLIKKVLVLVTGVGTPRNFTHSLTGNSTETCAQLMERFVSILYPDVTVVRIHSDTNIFRYDENIVFVKQELMPCIDSYRDAHARGLPYPDEPQDTLRPHRPFSSAWKQSFHVTLSFADGSPARTHAIQASLRSYRPTYFHVWQLKTFWHDTKIVDDDIEVHSFEEMETEPAIYVSDLQDVRVKQVVQKMKEFRQDFLETMLHRNDIRQFWLRKTKKPCLAVLLVEDAEGNPKFYRGSNMEVSMPTGSLCAERNVIGSALADNPGLKREDLRMVAVLSVPLPVESTTTTVEPSRDSRTKRSESIGSYSSIVEDNSPEEEDWILSPKETTASLSSIPPPPPLHLGEGVMPPRPPLHLGETTEVPTFSPAPTPPRDPRASSTQPSTPVRRITLYSHASDSSLHNADSKPAMGAGSRRQKRTVLVHSAEDLNPLRPCGACNEWLKKIAECNPYFKVLTFTDADLAGIYVTPIQEY